MHSNRGTQHASLCRSIDQAVARSKQDTSCMPIARAAACTVVCAVDGADSSVDGIASGSADDGADIWLDCAPLPRSIRSANTVPNSTSRAIFDQASYCTPVQHSTSLLFE